MTTNILYWEIGLEPVTDRAHLRELLDEEHSDFAIVRDSDALREMTITRGADGQYAYSDDRGDIIKRLSFDALLTETNIGAAINRGAFFADVL